MLGKIIFITILLFYLVTYNYKFESIPFKLSEEIEIEVIGALDNPGIFKIKRSDTLNDILKDLKLSEENDLSTLSLNKKFSNKEILFIPFKSENKKISINGATMYELMQLKGIGEKIACKIIEYRNNNGGFKSLEELLKVNGIGIKKYREIKEHIIL